VCRSSPTGSSTHSAQVRLRQDLRLPSAWTHHLADETDLGMTHIACIARMNESSGFPMHRTDARTRVDRGGLGVFRRTLRCPRTRRRVYDPVRDNLPQWLVAR